MLISAFYSNGVLSVAAAAVLDVAVWCCCSSLAGSDRPTAP